MRHAAAATAAAVALRVSALALVAALGVLLATGSLTIAARPVTRPAASLGTPAPAQAPPGSGRARNLPDPLYGVTVDDVSRLGQIAASLRQLPATPTTRIYLDVREPASYYATAVSELWPASYLMGELLDSSDETHIGIAAYSRRVQSYLAAFSGKIDLWEIGNEVNGSWTGPYSVVSAKLTNAYREVKDQNGRTALTLYYNVGCGDGPAELSPLDFSRRYVPQAVRSGLDYVFLSYYPDACNGIQPTAATWTTAFQELHALYPHALLGFGEIGLNAPARGPTITAARSLMEYYYGLSVHLPYYVGGYFWWYYAEDCVPYGGAPLWPSMWSGFAAEAANWQTSPQPG